MRIPKVLLEMMTFAAIGSASFALDVGMYAFITRALGLYYLLANAVSFAIAVVLNFMFNRRFTFQHGHQGGMRQFAQFASVAATGLALNTFFLWFLVTSAGLHDIVAKFLAAAIVFLWNFNIQRYWTFRLGKRYTG